MRHLVKCVLALSVVLIVAGCSREDMNHFIASGQGDWSAMNTGQSYATTTQPRRCYQTSSQRMTCFN